MRSILALSALCCAACATAPAPSVEIDVRALVGYLEQLRAAHDLPGVSAALVLEDGTELGIAVGEASREEGTQLTTDDLLLSGSIGKTYVAALALSGERDGVLALDDRLAKHLGERPWFARLPNGPELTLRDLLRHQSGLARYVMERAFWAALFAEPERVWAPDELVAFILERPAAFAPGDGFQYSDTNYILVGMALERATGRTVRELVQERLLAPHGLVRTVPSDRRAIPGLVQGYDELFRAVGCPERVLGPDGRFVVNPQFEWCGGGYANTPLDLARWARLLYSGRALDGDYLAALLDTVPAPELGPDVRYGPGVMQRATRLGELRGHDGVMLGYTARMGWFPERGVAVAVQTNTDKPGALGGPGEDVLTDLAELVSGTRPTASPR